MGSRNHCCYSDEERRRNRGPCAYDTRGKSERVVLGPLLMISRTIQVWSPPARSEGSCWPQELAFLLVAQVHEAVMPRSPGSRPAKPQAQSFKRLQSISGWESLLPMESGDCDSWVRSRQGRRNQGKAEAEPPAEKRAPGHGPEICISLLKAQNTQEFSSFKPEEKHQLFSLVPSMW